MAAGSDDGTTITPGEEKLQVKLGQLQEVDLGPDATMRNIARTEAARRRLEAGQPAAGVDEPPKKVRLGRDGKPRRNRWRRNSEDMKRDEMVDRLMKESGSTCALHHSFDWQRLTASRSIAV
jgi:predicted dienelactone hydrolase